VLIPLQCEYYALEGLSMMTRLIGQIRQSGGNPDLELDGIVMTMFDARTNLAQQVVDEVRQHFGAKVYDSIIPRNIRISEAPSHGLPVILYEGKSSGAESYRQFAKEFLKRRKAATVVDAAPPPAVQPVPEPAPAPAGAITAPPAAPAPDAPPTPPADVSTVPPG
jgi:chromosome partitioning protein